MADSKQRSAPSLSTKRTRHQWPNRGEQKGLASAQIAGLREAEPEPVVASAEPVVAQRQRLLKRRPRLLPLLLAEANHRTLERFSRVLVVQMRLRILEQSAALGARHELQSPAQVVSGRSVPP